MVLPIRSPQIVQEALLRAELEALTEEEQANKKYRDYYDGEQALVYATERFKEIFGDAFEGFKDNWMRVIIGAVQDKMVLTGIGVDKQASNADDRRSSASAVWDVFRRNEIDEEQYNLHEGILVESRGAVIVWPDPELGATIDWQPAGLIRVRYNPERRRQALWAVKRWQSEDGSIYVNIYTPDAVYKYVEQESDMPSASSPSAVSEIPDVGSFTGLEVRQVPNELWPLPHPFGQVPVVEFNNTSYRSELKDHIPQQDALNKTLLDMMVASEFHATPQRVIESLTNEPAGGWRSGAAEVWHMTPGIDAEGKPVRAQWGEFDAADPSNFIKVTELFLTHIAHTSRTPIKAFLTSDRGGRGDAPSGESLQIEEGPLNQKVSRKQPIWGNRWMDVAKLVASVTDNADPDALDLGDAIWKDPRFEFRMAVLEEAAAMVNIGLPFKYIITQLGLTPSEQEQVMALKEEEDAETERKELEMMEKQASLAAANQPPSSSSSAQ